MLQWNKIVFLLMATGLIPTAIAAEFASQPAQATVELQTVAMEEAPATGVASAGDKARAWLRKAGKHEGANETILSDGTKETSLIYIGTYKQTANSRTVGGVRAMGAMVAALNAKVEIAKFLNSDVSAEIRYEMPQATPTQTEFEKQRDSLTAAINDMLGAYEDAVRELDAAKADQIAGISMNDVLKASVSAAIEKLDLHLDVDKLSRESAERLERLRTRIKELDAQLKKLKADQEKLAGTLNSKAMSTLDQLASMVITGAVVVNSWESMQNGTYECAVAVVWSPAQERFMRSTLGLDRSPVRLKPTTSKTLTQYLEANEGRWQNIAGGRWFVDCDGIPHLIAVGAHELKSDQPFEEKQGMRFAGADAMHYLALALQADTNFQLRAERKDFDVKKADGSSEAQIAESLAETVNASVKNLKLQGVTRVYEGTLPSPVSTRKLAVVVYEFSPLGKQMAENNFKTMTKSAQDIGRAQNELKGYINESQKKIDAARSDVSAYNRGQGQASQNTAAETGSSTTSSQSGRLRNSSFGGDGEEDFKF